MKDLIKIMLALALVFVSLFIIVKATGLVTLNDILGILEQARQIHPGYLALVVIGLLFADLFITVPTMTVSILAGNFLGWPIGVTATISGLFLAGITGYGISRIFGGRLLNRVYKDRARLAEVHNNFSAYGPIILILSRAVPMLPEISCCMAGATRMPFYKFLTLYALGTIPYALITTYVGSISTVDKPTPAIVAAIGISLTLWGAWFLFGRNVRNHKRVV